MILPLIGPILAVCHYLLIQIGGLGVVTVAGAFAIRVGQKDRTDAAKHHAGSDCGAQCGGIVRLTGLF